MGKEGSLAVGKNFQGCRCKIKWEGGKYDEEGKLGG